MKATAIPTGVLALLDDRIQHVKDAHAIAAGPHRDAVAELHGNLVEARAAVAELIEAGKELQFIRNNGCAADTYDRAARRHDAAIARVQGGAA